MSTLYKVFKIFFDKFHLPLVILKPYLSAPAAVS